MLYVRLFLEFFKAGLFAVGGGLATLGATLLLAPRFGIHGVFAACAIGWGFECLYIVLLLVTGFWLPTSLRVKVLNKKSKKLALPSDL